MPVGPVAPVGPVEPVGPVGPRWSWFSMSVMTLTVIVFANWYPTPISCAVVPSWARTMFVMLSPDMASTRTISAFACVGVTAGGQTVALNGGVG